MDRKLEILYTLKNKLNNIILIILIFSFGVSQIMHTHEPTGISFYETASTHLMMIENVRIDNIDASIALYDTEDAPINDLNLLLNPNNPDDADVIFIYYSPNAGTSPCVGWTYYHKSESDKTVLRVFGNDLNINNEEIIDSYPTAGASGDLFSFKLYDADANEFGDIDYLDGFINSPLTPFSNGGNQPVYQLIASNIHGCEDPNAFNPHSIFTAPCPEQSNSSECQICGYPVYNFYPIQIYIGLDANEDIDCDEDSEEGNDITIHWNEPESIIDTTEGFEYFYIIEDLTFAGSDTVIGDTVHVIENKYDWGAQVTLEVYAWNGYEGQDQVASHSSIMSRAFTK